MIYVLIAVIIIGLIYFISLYNMLVSRRNGITYASASINALLKKRFDLIPNLVSSVKEYMGYEKGVLNQLTELRTQFKNTDFGKLNAGEADRLDKMSAGLLKSIFVSMENYPDLKASENVLQLQAALNEVEEQLSAARRAFNASVMEYNNMVIQFPSSIIAGMFNFTFRESFTVSEEEGKPVNVGNLFKQ